MTDDKQHPRSVTQGDAAPPVEKSRNHVWISRIRALTGEPFGPGFEHLADQSIGQLLGKWMTAFIIVLSCVVWLYSRYPGNFASYATSIPPDFGVYMKAWARLLQGESPYVIGESHAFMYSPSMLALIRILPKTPQDAWFWFSSLSILSLGVSALVGARYRTWRDVACLVIGILLSGKGILECLDAGQPELLILGVLIMATVTFPRATLLSGAIFGMLPWVKLPTLFLLIPFILAASRKFSDEAGKPPMRRLKLWTSGFLLSSVFWGAAVPSIAFGPEKALELSQAWYKMLQAQPSLFFSSDVNQSLWASVQRWFELKPLISLGVAGVFGGVLLGMLVMRVPQAPTSRDAFIWISPWLIISQLVNPLSWKWGSAYLLGVAFSAFRSGRQFLVLRGVLWILVVALLLGQHRGLVNQVLGIHEWNDLHDIGITTAYWILLLILSV